jgi:hypothetical protein
VCITSTADRLADTVAGSRTLYCKTTSNAGCSAGVVALAAFQNDTPSGSAGSVALGALQSGALSSCAAACDAAVGCAGFSFTSTFTCQLQSSGMPTRDAQPALNGACFNTLPGDVLSTLVNLACPAGTFLAGQSCYFCPIGAFGGGCTARAGTSAPPHAARLCEEACMHARAPAALPAEALAPVSGRHLPKCRCLHWRRMHGVHRWQLLRCAQPDGTDGLRRE